MAFGSVWPTSSTLSCLLTHIFEHFPKPALLDTAAGAWPALRTPRWPGSRAARRAAAPLAGRSPPRRTGTPAPASRRRKQRPPPPFESAPSPLSHRTNGRHGSRHAGSAAFITHSIAPPNCQRALGVPRVHDGGEVVLEAVAQEAVVNARNLKR